MRFRTSKSCFIMTAIAMWKAAQSCMLIFSQSLKLFMREALIRRQIQCSGNNTKTLPPCRFIMPPIVPHPECNVGKKKGKGRRKGRTTKLIRQASSQSG
jgi:hypothetical protein